MEKITQFSDLSPTAQAVLDAYEESNDCYREERGQLAAALRTAAEQIEDLYCESDVDSSDGLVFALRHLMLIATELEGA